MEAMYFLVGVIPILIYLGIIAFAIYAVITIINLMKERNEYLQEISNEIKKNNSIN